MFQGKVGAALKFLEEQSENAVLPPTGDIVKKLEALHPAACKIHPETLIEGPISEVNPATFYSIDETEILKAANSTKGSGGPSLLDAQQWKRLLCSNKYKTRNYVKKWPCSHAKFLRRSCTPM